MMTHFLLSCDHIIERDSRPPKLVRCAECPKTSDGNPKRKLVGECTPDGMLAESYTNDIDGNATRVALAAVGALGDVCQNRMPEHADDTLSRMLDSQRAQFDAAIVRGASYDSAVAEAFNVHDVDSGDPLIIEQLTESELRIYRAELAAGASREAALHAVGFADSDVPTTAGERTETSSDDVASEQSAAQIFERYRLAKAEHKQIQQWRAEHGDEPIAFATPNLDGLRSDVANGVRVEDRIVRPARTTSSTPKRERKPAPQLDAGAVQFYRNGAPLRGKHNRLSSLAGYCKIPVTELRSKLAEIGVDSPETSNWELTLTTGVKLAAVVTAASES